MRRIILSLAVFALAAAVPLWAQSQSKTLARVITIRAKAGEGQQWEGALKRLNAWEHEHKLPGNSYTWIVISGSDYGEYVVGTFGHDWADFDAMQKRGDEVGIGAENQATVAPYTESVAISYYDFQTDLSINPPDPNKPPAPLTEVTFFTLKPGGMARIVDVIKQANEAIKKTHWPGADRPGGWYELVNGGDGPQIVLAVNYQNWAGLQATSPSFSAILEEVYGKPGAQALGRSFNNQLRNIRTQFLHYRPDLSYIAPAQ